MGEPALGAVSPSGGPTRAGWAEKGNTLQNGGYGVLKTQREKTKPRVKAAEQSARGQRSSVPLLLPAVQPALRVCAGQSLLFPGGRPFPRV